MTGERAHDVVTVIGMVLVAIVAIALMQYYSPSPPRSIGHHYRYTVVVDIEASSPHDADRILDRVLSVYQVSSYRSTDYIQID